jgi:hypothetical protein
VGETAAGKMRRLFRLWITPYTVLNSKLKDIIVDSLILKNPGEGVITGLKSAFDQAELLGEPLFVNLFGPEDAGLDQVIADRISSKPNEPVFLVIDLEGNSLKDFDMPLLSIISTRIVAGQQLPVGSKVIVATNVDKDRAVQDLSSPTVARLNIVDLKNSTLDVRKQELLSLVDFASTMSYQEVTASKSQAVKAMNPDAVDVKMAERTSWKDMATYPKDM